MLKNPPANLLQQPENYFRRKQREITFYLSTTFRMHLLHFVFCGLIIGLHVLVMSTPLLERFEYVFLDFFFRQRPVIFQHPAIVLIDMAEDSMQVMGRWPWPRHNHAALVHILNEWGAKAIVFDVVFSEPSTTFDDESFLESIKKSKNVYLPLVLETVGDEKFWIYPVPEFAAAAKGTGHVNIFPDRDGTIRRIMPFLSYEGKSYPYLAIQVAYDFLGKPLPKTDALPSRYLDDQERLLINWTEKWKGSFRHYSYVDVIRSYAAIKKDKKPLIAPDQIRNKVCIIGLTALGLTDIKANPLEETYPAVGVQANVLNSILTKRFVHPASKRANLMAMLLVGIVASFVFIFAKKIRFFVVGLAWGFSWVAFAFWMFVAKGVWLYVVNPLLLIFSLFVFSTIFAMTIGRKERERLFMLATQDGLTGLYVIRHFRTLLNEAVTEAYRKKTPLSLLLIDIDFFKKVNDQYGHAAGDLVLKRIPKIMETVLESAGESKENNPLGRYGGEEFIVMLKGCYLVDAAFNFGEKFRRLVEQAEFLYEGVKLPVTISIGVATLHPDETVPDLMVHRADEALYRAKMEGRNRTCIEHKEQAV